MPTNGLVIYCGTIVTDEGKEKKVNIDFEPFRPINTSLYLCDNKFHTEVYRVNCVKSAESDLLRNYERKPIFISSPGQRPCEFLPSLGVHLSYVVNFHI